MTLTLYLLRHAKAVVADGKTLDFDRPLAERGGREAAELAELMAERSYAPALVLCSSSQRTRETLGRLLAAWPVNLSIDISRSLYNADADDLLTMVRGRDGDARSMLMVGHNPGIERLAQALAGTGDEATLRRLRDHYPPAGLAVIDFDVPSWRAIGPSTGRLTAFETPRG